MCFVNFLKLFRIFIFYFLSNEKWRHAADIGGTQTLISRVPRLRECTPPPEATHPVPWQQVATHQTAVRMITLIRRGFSMVLQEH